MKKTFILCIAILIASHALIANPTEEDYIPGSLIVCFSAEFIGNTRGVFDVTFENGIIRTPFTWLNQLADEFQIETLERMFFVKDQEWNQNGRYPMNVFKMKTNQHNRTNELMDQLNLNNNILFVEHEAVIITFPIHSSSVKSNDYLKTRLSPNDPLLSQQWYLENIQAFEAWEITTGSPDVVVGINDHGIKWNHEDLADNMWINQAELPGITIDWTNGAIIGGDCPGEDTHTDGTICPGDNDGNGYCDDVMGWDFFPDFWVPQYSNNPYMIASIHGTIVSGVVSASANNERGIAGIANTSKIIATKHRDNENILESHFYRGIIYLADLGVRIINCSWGDRGLENVSNLVVSYAKAQGALVIAAVGNSNTNVPSYPAASIDALAVAATDIGDQRSIWSASGASNYGAWIDISAPGSNILTTTYIKNEEDTIDSYDFFNGTSLASPIVSAVAALLLSKNPGLTVDELKYYLLSGADPIDHLNPGYEGLLGAGRVNAFNSLNMVTMYENDLWARTISGETSLTQNISASISVSVRNNGLNTANGYNINLISTAGDVVLATLPGVQLSHGETYIFNFEWTPTILGQFHVYSQIEWSLDENINNNQTNTHRINVLPDDLVQMYIGDISSPIYLHNSFLGYHRFWPNSRSQSIYYENELIKGDIYKMSIRFMGDNPTPAKLETINIFMTTSNKMEFDNDADWIPDDLFTNVFSGHLNLSAEGCYDIDIVLDKPFHYLSDNLVVMATREIMTTFENANERSSFQFTPMIDSNRTILTAVRLGSPVSFIHQGITNARFFIQTDENLPPKPVSLLMPENNSTKVSTNPTFQWILPTDGFIREGLRLYITTDENDWETFIELEPSTSDFSFVDILDYETTYYWKIIAYNEFGDSIHNQVFSFTTEKQVNISEETKIPIATSLSRNYPNPFNPETTIHFSVANDSKVVIEIFNIRGQKVKSLVNETKTSGNHQVIWSGFDDNGSAVSSGVYFYRMMTDNDVYVRRMIMMK